MHSTFRRPRLAVTLGLGALAIAGWAAAEPAPNFTELLSLAQTRAPRLSEARADIAKAEGLARQAAVIPNPVVAVDMENFAGSGPYSGTGLSETTVSAQQVLELGGKRSARISASQAELEAARRRAQRAAGDFAFDLANAYAAAEASDRRLALANEAFALAQEDGRIAGALVEAGREPTLRRIQTDAATEAARAAVDEARAQQATAFANLTALSGSPMVLTSIPTGLLDRPQQTVRSVAPPTSVAVVAAARAEEDAALRRLRLERTRAIPDLAVSVGVRRYNEDDATALVAGFSVPLPLFDRNRGNIAAARADLDAAQARAQAAQFDTEAAIRSTEARIGAAESRLSASRAGEAAAAEAYRLTRIGYEAGKLGLTELTNARRALVDARTQTIAAGTERVSAQAALARLNGSALQGDPS